MKNQPIWHRARYALEGLRAAWRSERSVRAHGMAVVAGVLLLIYFDPRPQWWALALLALGLMIVTELVNTAVEKLVDLLHPGQHPDVKFVKDVLAGAVFISCVVAGFIMLLMIWVQTG